MRKNFIGLTSAGPLASSIVACVSQRGGQPSVAPMKRSTGQAQRGDGNGNRLPAYNKGAESTFCATVVPVYDAVPDDSNNAALSALTAHQVLRHPRRCPSRSGQTRRP